MALPAGRHQLGPEIGRIALKTFRDGLAAQAGHDLVIDVTRWSGEMIVDDDQTPAALSVRIDMGSLVVREGTGGFKPLTDADRREIAATARRVLGADRHPEAEFAATRFEPGESGGDVDGTFTLRGVSRPLRLHVAGTGPDGYRVSGTVLQSAYGIKPYTAFLGALKVRDAVDIEVEATFPAPAQARE